MATPHFPTQYKCSSLFTHNLTMNQDSDDLSAYKFKIQHLPSFCWRTFGTALFGQQTLSHFMPNQNRNWPRIHEFSLVRSRRHKQLFWVATPSLRVFIQPALGSAWWENTVKSFPYRVQIQLGRFAFPHLIGWGVGVTSLYLCLLLHQRRWVVTQAVFLSGFFLFLWLDDITSNQQLLCALFWEPGCWFFLPLDSNQVNLVTLDLVALRNTYIWIAMTGGKAISSSNKKDNWTHITWQCAARSLLPNPNSTSLLTSVLEWV